MALAAENSDQGLTLEITRIFKAPRDRVFEAWTKPEFLAAWWGPKGMSLPEHEFNVHEGGTWRTHMRSSEGSDHIVSGVFKEVIDQEHLVFTWGWTIDGERSHESQVTVTFDDVQAGTKVHLHQALLTSTGDHDGHQQGWNATFENLDDFLDGKPRATS